MREGGCEHWQARTGRGEASSMTFRQSAQDLPTNKILDAYRSCVRYALHWRARPWYSKNGDQASPPVVQDVVNSTPSRSKKNAGKSSPIVANTLLKTNSLEEDIYPTELSHERYGNEVKRLKYQSEANRNAAHISSALSEAMHIPSCIECGLMDDGPCHLHCCLECVFIGCWGSEKDTSLKHHILKHMNKAKHSFAMDFRTLQVYCLDCHDYMYHHQFSQIMDQELFAARIFLAFIRDPSRSAIKFWKCKLRLPVSIESDNKIASLSTRIPCNNLRGLWNLGSTCFMNAILQVLLHTVPLRSYFLGDGHCECDDDATKCMACQMDLLFRNNYIGVTVPFAPSSFLFALWSTSKALASYSQHDAHEFYITALNGIHGRCLERSNTPHLTSLDSSIGGQPSPLYKSHGGPMCNCIVHTSFAGSLQSRVTCLNCGRIRDSIDPILDISLDISSFTGSNKGKFSLKDCLDSYIKPETLPADTYVCPLCRSNTNGATKQLSFQDLHAILPFHMKCYEQSTALNANKINAGIQLPLHLDMTRYTSENGGVTGASFDPVNNSNPAYQYSLYAVVNHEGKMETGHYTSHVQVQGQWYLFDDAAIYRASETHVISGEKAYMAFYRRNMIAF